MTLPIGVLVSGRGSNLGAILAACREKRLDARVVLVASNHEGVPALLRAARARVPHRVFAAEQYGTRAAAHGAMGRSLIEAGARLVVLAGFDQMLRDPFWDALGGEVPVINIHPALLPAFGGRGMLGLKVHEAVLAAGVAETGVTVHRAHRGMLDEGEIVLQRRVPVLPGDDAPTLSDRVLAVEHQALVEAIGLLAAPSAMRRA